MMRSSMIRILLSHGSRASCPPAASAYLTAGTEREALLGVASKALSSPLAVGTWLGGPRSFSEKPSNQDSGSKQHNQGEASTSGRPSEPGTEEPSASSAAGEEGGGKGAGEGGASSAADDVRRQSQEALNKVAEAARIASSFATGVAGELFKGVPISGDSKAKDQAEGARDDGTQGGAAGSSSGKAEGSSDKAEGRGSSSGQSAYERARAAFKPPGSLKDFVATLRSEVAAAVLPSTNLPSVMRKRVIDEAVELKPGEGPSQIMAVQQEQTYWEKAQHIFGNNPLYQTLRSKLGGSAAAKKVQEFSQDVRERIETTDSEVVNRMVDMRANLMAENEQAITYREIKTRNPGFDMPTFLQSIRNDIPIVIKAYLEGQEDVLKEFCSDSMVERLMGIYNAGKLHGQIHDSTILEYSDVDLVDMKMVDGSAVLVLHFNCQQINCYRDNYGNVVSGAPDEVNRMYYYWAVQQDGHGIVTKDGKFIPPRWMLVEMMLRGMHQLL